MKNFTLKVTLRYLLILFIFYITSSCLRFIQGASNSKFSSINIKNIEGKFYNIPLAEENFDEKKKGSSFTGGVFKKELSGSLAKDTLVFDKTQSFELKVMSKQKIEIKYYSNDSTHSSQIVEYDIGEDGFVYLKNKNVKRIWIPYIFGAIDIQKIRLHKDLNGNLIADINNHRSGAVFLIIFLDGRSTKNRFIYQKVN